jgi:hypothetical protein
VETFGAPLLKTKDSPASNRLNCEGSVKQRAVILRQHIQQIIRTLPHIANPVLELVEHRLAVKRPIADCLHYVVVPHGQPPSVGPIAHS